jgi:phosphoserine phosphatase RsbU/P
MQRKPFVRKLWKPAIYAMNRLNYPQKFMLISFIFILPISLLMSLLFSEMQSRIQLSQQEQVGNQYLRPLSDLSEDVLEYQIIRDGAKTAQDFKPETTRLVQEINADLNQLQQTHQRLGQPWPLADELQTLKQTWQQIQTNQFIWSPETRNTLLKQLLETMDEVRIQVGDQSKLILDPDLDSYYAMDATLLKLPELQRLLAQVRLISQQSASSSMEMTPTQRAELLTLAGRIQNLSRTFRDRATVAFNNNRSQTLRPAIEPDLNRLTVQVEALVSQMNQLVYINQSARPQQYLAQANRAFEQSFTLWDQTIDQLDVLLQRRIDGFQQRQRWVTLFVLAVLAIAAYLLISFYLGVMQVVSRLSDASRRMKDGNLKETISLDSRDELAEVVRSFNAVADALREAEANYRSIFENAMEGIFQTTPGGHYLSANPMLAKIYGYDSAQDLVQTLSNIGEKLYVDPNQRDRFAQLMALHGSIQAFESEVYRKDGSTIWISESARAIADQTGQILRYEGTVTDITQRKQADAKIQELTHRLQGENLRMSAELDVTRRLQQLLLPAETELQTVPGLDIAGFMEPAAEVGGDYYDVLQQDGKVRISIGDVTGHGLESGMVMIMAQTAVRTLLANGETNPSRFLNTVNRIIYDNTRRMNSLRNMTLAMVEYDGDTLCLSGQHEELIVVRANGTIEPIDTFDLGFPLGLEADITPFVHETKIRLYPNDLAVLYTDGITEATNLENDQYGLERLYAVLRENRDRPAATIRQAVIDHVMQHIGTQKIYDDITLLVMKQK